MKPIILNDNYRIEKDAMSWVMIFSEKRKKLSKGKFVPYIFEDKWYYPDIKQLLRRWIELDLGDTKSISELSAKMDKIAIAIDSLKNTIFKPQ